ncbi:hypothetical protein ACOJBO_24885 [Rhizobium beringeri]
MTAALHRPKFRNSDQTRLPAFFKEQAATLHNSLNQDRFKDKIMQHFKVLQRPLRVWKRRAAL